MNSNFKEKATEFVADVIERHDDNIRQDEFEFATKRQKDKDIKSAVQAFLELKASDAQIMQLLSKYFDVDSIEEANSIIIKAKKTRQIKALREYYKEQGLMNSSEFRKYSNDIDLEAKLASDQKLLDLSPEKLKKALEK